jgi:hypothetical protein
MMGRPKNNRLAEKPLNIRLYEEDYQEIKRLAQQEGVADSDVHRELVAEALQARRHKSSPAPSDSSEIEVIAALRRIELSLAEMKTPEPSTLSDEVQTLSSRIEFLCDQVSILHRPQKRTKPHPEPPSLFS